MITDLLLILTGVLGFTILFIIFINNKSNKILNINLAIIIFIVSFRQLCFGIATIYHNIELIHFVNRSNVLFVLVVPIFYIYFTNLILNEVKYNFKNFIHFIFPILILLEYKFSVLETITQHQFKYSFAYLFIYFCIMYLVLIFIKLKKFVWNKKATLEIAIKQNNTIKKWTIYLYIAMFLMVIRIIISILVEISLSSSINAQYGMWANSIIWITVFIKILSSPEILYGYSYLARKNIEFNAKSKNISNWVLVTKTKINNNQDQQLKEKIDSNIEKYFIQIDNHLISNNYFRNPEYKINDMALDLKIPNSHLKYIFKYHSKLSFSDYKKIARIQDSLDLIDGNYLATNTMESLSKEVGFTSYNPFFTSFKDVVGKSPQQYITDLNKDI